MPGIGESDTRCPIPDTRFRKLTSVTPALSIPPERLYAVAGWFEPESSDKHEVETAVRTDPRLTDSQKDALIAVYRGFLNQAREK